VISQDQIAKHHLTDSGLPPGDTLVQQDVSRFNCDVCYWVFDWSIHKCMIKIEQVEAYDIIRTKGG